MKEPIWLERVVLETVHLELLSIYGGLEGIRDEGLLDTALGRPEQLFAYGEPDLFDLATSYAYGIVRNHPFLDGNKRAGFMAAYTFLIQNGWRIFAKEEEVVLMTIGLAAGELQPEGYAMWLRENCKSEKGS